MKTTQRSLTILTMWIAVIAAAQLAGAAGITTWIGVPNTSATTNWSDTLNWSPGAGASNPPGTADTVAFGGLNGSGATVVDNVVDTNFTIASLIYTNVVAANGHDTMILSNVTLTVNGLVSVGPGSATTTEAMSGPGNFINNNVGGPINIGGSGASTQISTITLADGTNTINVTTVSIGESGGNNGRQCTLNLGNGVNIINADTINLGTGKAQGTIQFAPTSTTGGIMIHNAVGTGRAAMTLAFPNSGTSSCQGKMLFAGGTGAGNPVSVLASTLTMARMGNDTGSGASAATISMDNGIFDVTSIIIGSTTTSESHAMPLQGTFTLGGNTISTATLIVNSPSGPGNGTFLIADATTGTTTAAGTLTINTNGVAQIYSSITKAVVANNTGTINVTGGTLIMEAAKNTIGTPTVPIDNLTLDTATLQFAEDGSSLNAAIGTLNLNNNTNVVNITTLPQITHLPTSIPIITYSTLNLNSGVFNLGLGTLPGTYQGYITNDGVSIISLIITSGPVVVPKHDEWIGSVNTNWDVTTLNWTNASLTLTNYAEGDFVTFDDNGKTNLVALLGNQHTPSGVTVSNNILNYTFFGPGKIFGATGLVKSGSGSLMMAESGGDGFAGGIVVHGGTLVLDNASSTISGGLTNDLGTVVQFGNNDANGVLPLGNLDDEGTLVFNRTDNITIAPAIPGGGGVTQSGTGTLTFTNINTYTGATTVSAGTLSLSGSGSVASALTFVKNSTLDLSHSAGSLVLNALALTNGTLNISGVLGTTVTSLSLSNATINLVADANITVGGQANITTTGLVGGTTNTINVTSILNLQLSPTLPIIVPLIKYTSATFGGGFNFGLIVPLGVSGFISNDVANTSIELVITNAPQNLTWNGASLTDNNWSDAVNWNGTPIAPADALFFDGNARLNNTNDTASGTVYTNITFNGTAGIFTLNGNPVVLQGTLLNNSSSTQIVNLGFTLSASPTFDGGTAGGALAINGGITNITGTTKIVTLQDTGTINDFWATNSGATGGGQIELLLGSGGGTWTILDGTGTGGLISAGSLQLAMNVGATSGEFDFGSTNAGPNSAPNVDGGTNSSVTISGAGTSSIQTFNLNSGTLKVNTVTLPSNGNNFFNVNGGKLILGTGSFNGGGGNGGAVYVATVNSGAIISTNGGTFNIAQRGPSTFVINGGLVQCGTLDIASGTAASGTGTNYLSGGTLICSNITCGLSAGNGSATMIFNGGTLRANSSSTTFFSQNNLVPLTLIVSTNGAIIDTTNFNDTINFSLIHDSGLDVSQVTPDGGLTKLGTGTLTLSAANTYTGTSTVSNGTLLVSGTGSLVGDAIVAANGTLAGTGTVGGQVTANGTVAPGTTATTIGKLTVASNVTFNATGTSAMKLNQTGATNDVLLSVNGTITYGGTLSLTNISGTLTTNSTFKLFSAGTYGGAFAHLVPATPGAGLAWNTNTLATDGTLLLQVATVNTDPATANFKATVAGNSLQFTWASDHLGWQLYTNAAGLTATGSWFPVPGSAAVTNETITINPANPNVFFQLRYP